MSWLSRTNNWMQLNATFPKITNALSFFSKYFSCRALTRQDFDQPTLIQLTKIKETVSQIWCFSNIRQNLVKESTKGK